MTTKKIYGPWIKWNGGDCPIPLRTLVEVKFRYGTIKEAELAENYNWYHFDHRSDIFEYRIFTEQPDLKAAEQLLLAHGYTVTKTLTFEDVEPMTEAPLKGARYWVISAGERDGACSVQFANDAFDRRIIQRRMAYLDREDALIAARHIFGLKGGEL